MDFDSAWERCGPWLQAALDHAGNTHTLDDVRALVERGERRLWAHTNCAVVTEVQEWPGHKVLLMWLAGGDLAELRDELHPIVEAWGREQGCTRSMIIGREGWVRALPGYRPIARICAKEL